MADLTTLEKIQNQKFIIERFDNLYNTINNKGNFLITFQSFLVGAVVVGNRKLDDLVTNSNWKLIFNCSSALLSILALVSLFFLLSAIFPFRRSGRTLSNNYKSLIYFNSIAKFDNQESYHQEIHSADDSKIITDLNCQTYQLACGLSGKFRKVARAINVIYCELGVLGFMILIIILSQYAAI
jgi:hypothetical protein